MVPGGKPPAWASIIMAAKDWGMPPWEVAGDGDKITWFYRWLEFNHWNRKAEEAAIKRAARRRNG